MTGFWWFSSPSLQISGQCLKLGHDSLLLHPFEFINHSPYYHEILCGLRYMNKLKNCFILGPQFIILLWKCILPYACVPTVHFCGSKFCLQFLSGSITRNDLQLLSHGMHFSSFLCPVVIFLTYSSCKERVLSLLYAVSVWVFVTVLCIAYFITLLCIFSFLIMVSDILGESG